MGEAVCQVCDKHENTGASVLGDTENDELSPAAMASMGKCEKKYPLRKIDVFFFNSPLPLC